MNKVVLILISVYFFLSCKSKDGECFIIYDKRQIEDSYFFLWERELDFNNNNNGVNEFQSLVNQLKIPYEVYSRFGVGDEFCRE